MPFSGTSDRFADRLSMDSGTSIHRAFRDALFEICGSWPPPRSELKKIGRRAAEIVGRKKPWGGAHLYTLLHWDRWPKYQINPQLFKAVLKMAGVKSLNGKRAVVVLANKVREGAVVLAKSRRCARRRCGVHFVPVTPNQKFDSENCERRAAASRRKHRKEKRRRNKSGRRMR